MATIEFIFGGARSGKSTFAQQRAESLPGPRAYVATCPVRDDEMAERVRLHREMRSEDLWDTIEAPDDLVGALKSCAGYNTILVDCVTLWINTVLFSENYDGLTELDVADRWEMVLDAAAALNATVLFVSNEVGTGIVPGDAASRLFRDAAGRCNQLTAARADSATFMAAGLPMKLK